MINNEEKKTLLQRLGLGLPVDSKGISPNVARSSEDWNDFRIFHKANNPIRYFLNEKLEETFIWPWSMPLRRAKEWILYRTTRRYHMINTGMTPGYSDKAEQILHVNFNMLKDFIEIEKAHMWEWSESRFKSEQPGVSHLIWEMGLDDSFNQAESAREQYTLYDWWTNHRPLRVDSFETPEHKAYWKLREEIYKGEFFCSDKDTPELKALQKSAYDIGDKLNKKQEEEDTDMLIRLIKIRSSLWT